MPRGGRDLVIHQSEPFNAGPTLDRLVEGLITPTERLYVRNHAPVPDVDPQGHRLRVEGLVHRPLILSLRDLTERFERVEVVATLACAGNRRRELMEVADLPGETPWEPHAVGTAAWSGWRLADVLEAADLRPEARHLAFTGLDAIEHGHGRPEGFGASIPRGKATSPEVLLADRVNGQPLPPDHGSPLRVVVPGYIGARSVKWLARVEARADPSDNHYQRHAYRLYPPGLTAATGSSRDGFALGELPVNSAICRPGDGSRVPAGTVTLEGYALSAGREIQRVDLTADGGASWTQAQTLEPAGQWGWTLWRADLALPAGDHEIAVRAVDAAANTQPESAASLWNRKGYVNNAWHHIRLTAR